MPPIRAAHLIFSAYGFWLPNDPRGSWSKFVGAWELVLASGRATKTTQRRSLAYDRHDREKRRAGVRALKYEPVRFNGRQALSVANGFARAIRESNYAIYACSILPQHVHLVVKYDETRIFEKIVAHLKARATQQLLADGLHPFSDVLARDGHIRSPWGHRPGWQVFLHSSPEINRAIRYVCNNPLKEGKPVQHWSFVRPFAPLDAPRKRGG